MKNTEFPFRHGEFWIDITSSGHDRVNCNCGACLVRQPYMNGLTWNKAVIEFELQHLEMVKDEIK